MLEKIKKLLDGKAIYTILGIIVLLQILLIVMFISISLGGCQTTKTFRNMAEQGCINEGGIPVIYSEAGNSYHVYIGCEYSIKNNLR